MLVNKENVGINCYRVGGEQCSILNLPHIVPVCMLSSVKSHHCTKKSPGDKALSVIWQGPHVIHGWRLLYVSLKALSNVCLTSPLMERLFRVSDHKLLVFIMPTQEPMN